MRLDEAVVGNAFNFKAELQK